jgi:hypothetical protein
LADMRYALQNTLAVAINRSLARFFQLAHLMALRYLRSAFASRKSFAL